jgi:hypothetical protein
VEALSGKRLKGDIEELASSARGGKSAGHIPVNATEKGTCTAVANQSPVRPQKQTPALDSRRPPEPLRPEPARRAGISLLAAKARRRRFRRTGPPFA